MLKSVPLHTMSLPSLVLSVSKDKQKILGISHHHVTSAEPRKLDQIASRSRLREVTAIRSVCLGLGALKPAWLRTATSLSTALHKSI